MRVMVQPTESKTGDVEVLPPQKPADPLSALLNSEAVPRLVALFMDNLFKVPGTKFKFGLNPLLDLVPGIGDAGAAVISALTLYVSAQRRVPKIVLARMGMNILLNSVVGIIPGVGEAFALWFRPSQRNYELLQKHISGDAPNDSAAHHWLFVLGLIGGVLFVFGFCVAAGAYLFVLLFHALFKNGL
jgi:hypothetical protein